jgi:hypothetical protein
MKTKISKGPLKKIVREFVQQRKGIGGYTYFDRMEELECGHIMHQKSDIYGPTNAVSRRCWKCRDEIAKAKETYETR